MNLMLYGPLFFLLLLIPVLIVFWFSLVTRHFMMKWSAFILRVTGIVLLILAVCRPFTTFFSKRVHIIFLVDVSESVDLDSVSKAYGRITKKIRKLDYGDSYSIFYFASGLRYATLKDFKHEIKRLQDKGFKQGDFRKQTKVATALLGCRLSFPPNKRKLLFLYTDGIDTEGRLEEAVRTLNKDKIDLRINYLQKIRFPEVSIISLKTNTGSAYYGESVRFIARLAANYDTGAKLRFINRGVVFKEIPVNLKRDKETPVTAEFIMRKEMNDVWEAEVVSEKDHFPVNNKATCRVKLRGAAKVLALHVTPSELKNFSKALKPHHIDVEVRGKFGFPGTMSELFEFGAILIADFPATFLSPKQMVNLKRYVMDFGGGVIMTGSENSFGLGGYYKTPVEDVLPVISRYEKEKEQPSLAMALVIDKSGSMNGEPILLAREAAKATVELLSTRDQIAVVAFDNQAYAICDMISAVNSGEIQRAIDEISAGGGTSMYPAMLLGKELLEKTFAKIKHMIILSDGRSTPGDFEGLASEMADMSMTVSTVALGGADRNLMSSIAEIGRGRYYETMDAESIPRIFTKETIEASHSAIKEQPFVPVEINKPDFLRGINCEKAPFLLGYVMTRSKPSTQVCLLTENGDPLLAYGHFGLGNGLAFTSGITEKWAAEWLEWRYFGKFWSQVVRAVLRQIDSSGIAVDIVVKENKVLLNIVRRPVPGEVIDKIDWNATLLNEDGVVGDLKVKQIGLGRYETEFNIAQQGNYTLRLRDLTNNKMKLVHFKENYPREYRLGESTPEILAQLPGVEQEKEESEISIKKSIQNYFCVIAMLCLLAGILLRRI